MKHIVGAFFSILVFGLVACGNEGDESPVITRKNTSYLDFKMYEGTAVNGAEEVLFYPDTILNRDSLYRSLTLYKYLTVFSAAIENENKIAFEFLENGMLSYTNISAGKKIVSSYAYSNDSLFVLKDVTEMQFVAVRGDNDSFYRTKSVMRRIKYDEDPEKIVNDTISENKIIDLGVALKFADIDNAAAMTNPNDTLVWCNVKYTYN